METYTADKQFTAGPLRGSRLRLVAGAPPALEVIFAHAGQGDLFQSDSKNKQDLRAFLISRLGPTFAFTLSLIQPEKSEVETPANGAMAPAETLEELMLREPIVKTLLEMFEGRILD